MKSRTRETTRSKRALIALGLVAAATLAACSGGSKQRSAGDEPAGAVEVAVRTFQFEPKTLEVETGTEVTWTNHDDIDHTVTSGEPGSPDGTFDEPLPEMDAQASVSFEEAGTFAYFCNVHQGMTGEISVT